MSCWVIVTSPGHWGELTRSLWTLETLRLPPPALSSPLETSGTWGSPGALPHLPLAIAPVSVRCRRRTFPAEGWSVSASSRCCFPTESWVSWAFRQACPPSPCRGGAGAGGPPCGSRSPGGPRPAALPDGGAPPPHAGVWAAAGSAAEPAARVSKRESTIKRWNGEGLKTRKKIERKQQVCLYVLLSQQVLLSAKEGFIVFSSYFTQTSGFWDLFALNLLTFTRQHFS